MPISLPASPSYRTGRWRAISNARRFESSITRTTQTVGMVGDLWACQMDLPPMDEDEAYLWAATLVQLTGGREAVYVYPPYRRNMTGAGTPLVQGGGQVGSSLLTDGWAPGYTLLAGSWFHFAAPTFRSLHITIANATADGSGNMTIPIRHAIRKSPADNAPLTLERPSCEMITEGSDIDILDLADALTFGMSMSFREAPV